MLSALRSPLSALRSPLSRSPLSLSALRSPLSALRVTCPLLALLTVLAAPPGPAGQTVTDGREDCVHGR